MAAKPEGNQPKELLWALPRAASPDLSLEAPCIWASKDSKSTNLASLLPAAHSLSMLFHAGTISRRFDWALHWWVGTKPILKLCLVA